MVPTAGAQLVRTEGYRVAPKDSSPSDAARIGFEGYVGLTGTVRSYFCYMDWHQASPSII
jgi:hypothetical protein